MDQQTKISSQKILDTLEGIIARIEDPEVLTLLSEMVNRRLLSMGMAETLSQNGSATSGIPSVPQLFEPRPEIQLELKNEVWYAVRQSDDRRIRLCDRLSTYQLNLQTQKRPPSRRSFLLEEEEALTLIENDPEAVAYWQNSKDGEESKQYYRVRDFRDRYGEWQRYMRLAQDEMTQDLGLTVEARAVIQKLEDQGYLVLPPDWIF